MIINTRIHIDTPTLYIGISLTVTTAPSLISPDMIITSFPSVALVNVAIAGAIGLSSFSDKRLNFIDVLDSTSIR